VEKSLHIFDFISRGPKGNIEKIIKISETSTKGYYNLAFGNKLNNKDEIDDHTISNNDDRDKILATVVQALYLFTNNNKDAWIIAIGSTKSRTRLYRMGISKHIKKHYCPIKIEINRFTS
jgi:hypothetical protein